MQMIAQNKHSKLPLAVDFGMIRIKIARGLYMSCVIAPMPNAKCKICGGNKFHSKMYDERLKISVFVCDNCGGFPNQLRVRRMLPIGQDGKSERVDILWDRTERRITSVDDAIHISRSIDYDLRDGRFDPNDYRPKRNRQDYGFKSLIESHYLPACVNKFGEKGFDTKKTMINHLVNFFDNMNVKKIQYAEAFQFQQIYKCGERSKNMAIQELGVILEYFKKMRFIDAVPTLPETKQSRIRSVNEFLTREEQEKVISYIKDEYYKGMIQILAEYGLRPGDLRAIKWGDIDMTSEEIRIDEHFAKSILKPGRKSVDGEHYLPMSDTFKRVLSMVPRSLDPNAFVFKAKDGHGKFTSGPVGEARMRIHWNKARKEAFRKDKIKMVSLYVGTKSTTLTALVNEGHSLDEIQAMTGHTNVKTLARYAKETKQTKIKKVKNILNNAGKKASKV